MHVTLTLIQMHVALTLAQHACYMYYQYACYLTLIQHELPTCMLLYLYNIYDTCATNMHVILTLVQHLCSLV